MIKADKTPSFGGVNYLKPTNLFKLGNDHQVSVENALINQGMLPMGPMDKSVL